MLKTKQIHKSAGLVPNTRIEPEGRGGVREKGGQKIKIYLSHLERCKEMFYGTEIGCSAMFLFVPHRH